MPYDLTVVRLWVQLLIYGETVDPSITKEINKKAELLLVLPFTTVFFLLILLGTRDKL